MGHGGRDEGTVGPRKAAETRETQSHVNEQPATPSFCISYSRLSITLVVTQNPRGIFKSTRLTTLTTPTLLLPFHVGVTSAMAEQNTLALRATTP